MKKAIEIIKKQMKEQGCEDDTFEDIAFMQPHIFDWIEFFNLTEEDLK